MSIFFYFLALAACLSLAACSADEEEQRRLLDEIIERSAMIDSEKRKIISYEGDITRLRAHLDSVSKDAELYQRKSQELFKRNRGLSQEIDQRDREAKDYRHKITQLRADKQAKEEKIAELDVEIDVISADRDRLKGLTENLQKKIIYAQKILDEVRKVQNSVRLIVGTEKRLKEEGFLKTGRGVSFRKWYKLIGKPESDDTRVKLVPINQQLHLTLQAIPKALVDRSGRLELAALVDRSGKLKKGRDYKVSKSRGTRGSTGTTIITFTNKDFLGGADVLAVVKVKN